MCNKGYKIFLSELSENDNLFFYLVLTDDVLHSVISSPSILFIKCFETNELCYIVFNHQDDINSGVNINELIVDIDNFKGKKFVFDKKKFIQHIPIKNALDINLGIYFKNDKIINNVEYETPAHKFIKSNCNKYDNLNKVIPLLKHKELVENIFDDIKKIKKYDIFNESYYEKTNGIILETLSEIEKNGIYVDSEKFKKYFEINVSKENYVYSEYNLYTLTGRPSNRFNSVNYAALKKDNGERECFVSRFKEDGKMVLIDYAAFHPRIICKLINFDIPLTVDIYEYFAKLLFNKENVDYHDIEDAKTLVFRQLYGGIEEEYSHILYFHNLKMYIDEMWVRFNTDGYIETPLFKRKITNKQILDPYKLFNYLLQATEPEIALSAVNEVNIFLREKKSKAILYTYDSILFDVSNDEMNLITKDVVSIMMCNNQFPVKCYSGNSYNNLEKIEL